MLSVPLGEPQVSSALTVASVTNMNCEIILAKGIPGDCPGWQSLDGIRPSARRRHLDAPSPARAEREL